MHFHGQPFTDPSSIRQAARAAPRCLTRVPPRTSILHLVPLADAQREIVTHAPSGPARDPLPADDDADRRRAGWPIGGRKRSSPATHSARSPRRRSRTSATVDAAVPEVQVLRPLVGMDKQEIVDDARSIGTYEISTRKLPGLLRSVRAALPRHQGAIPTRPKQAEAASTSKRWSARRSPVSRPGSSKLTHARLSADDQ